MTKTIDLVQQAGEDGLLRVSVPVDEPGKRYHLIIHLEPEPPAPPEKGSGWPAGFFEETAGKWIGEFPTDSEGDYEERLPL